MEAKTEFEKTFYKILNVSVFGKLMEAQRRHLDIVLTNKERTCKTDSKTHLQRMPNIQRKFSWSPL